ncbi:peptide ABC transporter substrate-binding protein [Niallia sp. FSL K6-0077]|jgi:oligopeptide transport system substrate-binding protein|uniref:peptide ABC transporter substrate-binding protein n=1 Tax=Niallia sp. FSL K6-0077 TaxID=2954743 RepID=UPI0030FA0139
MKNPMKYLMLIISVSIVISSFVACSNTSNSTEVNSSNNSITIAETTSIDSLDPALAYESFSTIVVGNTIEGLYTIDNKETPQLAMAEKVETSKDGLIKTFTIRENAKWSNGDPVKADDFVYAWRRLADPTLASGFSFELEVAGIKNAADIIAGKKDPSELGVTAKDDKTLIITLDKPVPFLENLLSFSAFAPLNQKYVEEKGESFALSSQELLSNGPYKVVDWKAGDSTIKLEKNSDYYDAQNVAIDTVNFQVISDSQQALMSYENKNVDYAPLTGDLVSKYSSNEEYHNSLGIFEWYLMFNDQIEGLENVNLRKAIAYSIDKEQLTNNILKDGSIPAYAQIQKGFSFDSTNNNQDFTEQVEKEYVYDVDKAKEYWEKAKAETNVRDFTLIYEQDDPSIANVAAYIKSQIETNLDGMKVELQIMPKKTRLDKMKKLDYQVALTRWGPDYADPTAILSMYTSNHVSNYAGWSNKEFDQLLNAAATTLALDPAKRWEALQKAEAILKDSAVCIPLYQVGDSALIRSNINGLVKHFTGVSFRFKYASLK